MSAKKISIIAPSSPMLNADRFNEIITWLENTGYKVTCGSNFNSWFDQKAIYVGEDKARAHELVEAFQEHDSDFVWALRGGYGAARLLPYLKGVELNDKPLIGFSDITVLQIYLYQNYKMKPIHGPVLTQLLRDDEVSHDNFLKLNQLIAGEDVEIILKPLNEFSSSLKGVLIGGNLAVITSLLGTPFQIDTRDKILILEDVGERGYAIDRMLLQMQYAGKFNNVKAIIFGTFTEGNEKDGDDYTLKVLTEFSEKQHFPVFKTEFIGHGSYNFPYVMGGVANIVENASEYRLVTNARSVAKLPLQP